MLIRMLTIAAGPEWSAQPGVIVDRPEAEASALVAGGYAEPVDDAPTEADPPADVETTAEPSPATAPAKGAKKTTPKAQQTQA